MIDGESLIDDSDTITESEIEKKRRIRLSVAAYAYEFKDDSLMPDAEFDKECVLLNNNLHVDTNQPDLDKWFREHFLPYTGQWIYKHPELKRIKQIYVGIKSK